MEPRTRSGLRSGEPGTQTGFPILWNETNPDSGFPRTELKSGFEFPGTEPETDTPTDDVLWYIWNLKTGFPDL